MKLIFPNWVCSNWWVISLCPYLDPWAFCCIPSPVPLRAGSDGLTLVGTWHPARVNHHSSKQKWTKIYTRQEGWRRWWAEFVAPSHNQAEQPVTQGEEEQMETNTNLNRKHIRNSKTIQWKGLVPPLLLQSQSAAEEGWVWAFCTYVSCGLCSSWAWAGRRNPKVLFAAAFEIFHNVHGVVSCRIPPFVYSLKSSKFLWIRICLENSIPTVPNLKILSAPLANKMFKHPDLEKQTEKEESVLNTAPINVLLLVSNSLAS